MFLPSMTDYNDLPEVPPPHSVHEDLPYTSKLQQQTIVSILSKNKNYKYQNIDFYYTRSNKKNLKIKKVGKVIRSEITSSHQNHLNFR
jgi:hypothetical protein